MIAARAPSICLYDTALMPIARRGVLAWGSSMLGAPLFVRHARAADQPRFALGVASGHPGADRVVLWTRLTGAELPDRAEVRWQIADDEGFDRIAAAGVETAEAGWAHSVHAEPAGLEPDRWYWYRFEALGQRSATGRTRTAPAADAAATLRFAIASCQRWDHGHWAAWRHAAAQPLDLMMFLGDYIYEYLSPPGVVRAHEGPMPRTLAQYRARYAQYKSDPALQAAHAAFPWIVIWDDHEVENDYANDRGVNLAGSAFLGVRAAAYQAAWEHQPWPKASRPTGPDMAMHRRFAWGRLAAVHALDGRQYRNHQACQSWWKSGGSSVVEAAGCAELRDPQRSLLGMAQERWLNAGWDLERPWNLMAQTTLMSRASIEPVSRPAGGRYWTDGWDGYPAARERLLTTIATRRVPGAVVLGGDIHAHAVGDLKPDFDDPKSPVVASEFCGTSISSRGPGPAQTARVLEANPNLKHLRGDQRGYIDFSLDAKRLQARLWAVDRPDDPVSELRVAARYAVDAANPGAETD